MRLALFAALGVLGAVFLGGWVRGVSGGWGGAPHDGAGAAPGSLGAGGVAADLTPSWLEATIGLVTNFFDTLGIGSFAPTTSWYKLQHVVADERIPGTMIVGHTPPVIVQAFIFIAIIEVDPTTLSAMIGASVVGAWLGAGVVSGWPRRNIQIGMGVALLLAAVTFTAANLGFAPLGGDAIGLSGYGLGIAVATSFVLGALMTLGIGMYAPSMIVVSLLGLNPAVAFPIMMGSSAFLMPVAALRFIEERAYAVRPAVGLALGGIPAVLVAAFIVGSLPLATLRWLVVVVVTYAAVMMLRSAWTEGRGGAEAGPAMEGPGARPHS